MSLCAGGQSRVCSREGQMVLLKAQRRRRTGWRQMQTRGPSALASSSREHARQASAARMGEAVSRDVDEGAAAAAEPAGSADPGHT
jgi:hypothetical protein